MWLSSNPMLWTNYHHRGALGIQQEAAERAGGPSDRKGATSDHCRSQSGIPHYSLAYLSHFVLVYASVCLWWVLFQLHYPEGAGGAGGQEEMEHPPHPKGIALGIPSATSYACALHGGVHDLPYQGRQRAYV